MKTTRARRFLVIGAASLVVASLTGCSAIFDAVLGQQDAERGEDGQVLEESNVGAFALKIGDCIPEDLSETEFTETSVVPCSEPHLFEVFHEFDLRDGDFPSDEEIWDAVFTECEPAFEDFVGTAWEESALDYTMLQPTDWSWTTMKDRLVQCLVMDPAGEVTGSLRGTGR